MADSGQITSEAPKAEAVKGRPRQLDEVRRRLPAGGAKVARAPAIIVTVIISAVIGLSLWYLVQPQPLVIQGEADATRIDIAARVDGRVGQRPVERGDNVTAGQLLFQIDNPELLAKLHQAEAGLRLRPRSSPTFRPARGPRSLPSARPRSKAPRPISLWRSGPMIASKSSLVQATRQSSVSTKARIHFRSLSEPWTRRSQPMTRRSTAIPASNARIARADVATAQASIDTVEAQVDELAVKAPIAAQVYQIGAELGEYVSPGVPLLSLVDLKESGCASISARISPRA